MKLFINMLSFKATKKPFVKAHDVFNMIKGGGSPQKLHLRLRRDSLFKGFFHRDLLGAHLFACDQPTV
jgi:hypothetical protein